MDKLTLTLNLEDPEVMDALDFDVITRDKDCSFSDSDVVATIADSMRRNPTLWVVERHKVALGDFEIHWDSGGYHIWSPFVLRFRRRERKLLKEAVRELKRRHAIIATQTKVEIE